MTAQWVSEALRNVDRASTVAGRQLADLRSKADAAQKSVNTQATALRASLASHHGLMVDVRSVLRTLAKVSDKCFCWVDSGWGGRRGRVAGVILV